jgi:hypothetical protein
MIPGMTGLIQCKNMENWQLSLTRMRSFGTKFRGKNLFDYVGIRCFDGVYTERSERTQHDK